MKKACLFVLASVAGAAFLYPARAQSPTENWQFINVEDRVVMKRMRVPEGWLVMLTVDGVSQTHFVADANHDKWTPIQAVPLTPQNSRFVKLTQRSNEACPITQPPDGCEAGKLLNVLWASASDIILIKPNAPGNTEGGTLVTFKTQGVTANVRESGSQIMQLLKEY